MLNYKNTLTTTSKLKHFKSSIDFSFLSLSLPLTCSSQAAPSSPASMADVQLKGLAPDQSSSSSSSDNDDDEYSDDETQQDNSTMEISSRSFLPPPSCPPLSRPRSLTGSQVESTAQGHKEDKDGDDSTPHPTRTQLVFTANNTHSPSPLDRSPTLLQAKSFQPPPPLIPSSKPPTFYDLVSSSSSSQSPIKATPTTAAVVQGEASTAHSPTASVNGVTTTQLPINTAPFIYHLASAAQPVGGIRQSVLTPILTLLPSAQGLVASRQVVGAGIPQPVILSPPAQALGMSLASSTNPSLMSGFANVANGSAVSAQQHKTLLEQTLGLSSQNHVLSTEPTTGQQTLKSPVMDTVTSTARHSSPPRTLASIPLSEMTPQYTELKAFAEEFKNKRIRLGFTQGAVGQSLADKGYSNFAQSTISRFEQMQLSPTNAAAIKLVLEKWLQETENPEAAHSPSSTSPVIASRKRKRRAVFTPQTKLTLETYFKQNPRPNRHVIESVAQELELLPEEVRVWFCNKRQKEKQGPGCSGSSVQVSYKHAYERESSVSLSSSGANSPSSLYDSSFYPKRNTPSPPRNTTPFTIEELSKSSSMGTKTISSPMCIASPFATSPQGVVMALTTPRISLGVQPVPPTRVALPQLQVSQTTA